MKIQDTRSKIQIKNKKQISKNNLNIVYLNFGIYLLFVSCILFLCSSAFAEVKFKDVPATHWAANPVYDLVKMGITGGYPDKTFRGKKNITRYETAIFLSKLSDKLGAADIPQMKLELADMKDSIARIKSGEDAPFKGCIGIDTYLPGILARGGNFLGRGIIMNYRLKALMDKDLGQGARFKINLDTMDTGYNGVTREIFPQMIDLEGLIKINPVDAGLADLGISAPIDLHLTMGPGPIQHFDSTGLLPSLNGLTYMRPESGFGLSSKFFGVGFSGYYFQAAKSDSGISLTSRIQGNLKYESVPMPLFGKTDMSLTGDYLFKHPTSSGIKDLRAKLDFTTSSPVNYAAKLNLGFGQTDSSGWMVGGGIDYLDPLNTGTTVSVYASKIGSDFIPTAFATEEFYYAGLDYFDRPFENSTVNLQGKITQQVNKKLALVGIGVFRLSSDFGYGKDKVKSRVTLQAGLKYDILPQADLLAYYRIEQNPTISETYDFGAISLDYSF